MAALSQLSYSPVERDFISKGNTRALAIARRDCSAAGLTEPAEENSELSCALPIVRSTNTCSCTGRSAARDELGHVEVIVPAAARLAPGGPCLPGCALGSLRSRPPGRGLDAFHPRRELAVDLGDVAQQPLGVQAQRVAHLAQVGPDLQTLLADLVGRRAGLGQQLRLCCSAARWPSAAAWVALSSVSSAERRASSTMARASRVAVVLASSAARRDSSRVRCGLGPRLGQELRHLLLGGGDAVLGRPGGFGDPLPRAGLGLRADRLSGRFSRGDDRRHAVGGRAADAPRCGRGGC